VIFWPVGQVRKNYLAKRTGLKRLGRQINCGGMPFVTKILLAALRQLRSQDEDRYTWVDAISINQDDIDERNQQVR